VYVGMTDEEMDQILSILVVQEVSVIEADSDLSNYLSDAQIDLEIDLMRKFCDKAHKRGMRVVWYYPALEVITTNGKNIPNTVFKEHPDWVQYGLDGTANVFYGGSGQVFWVDPNDESAWMSPSSKGYRDYFFNRVRRITSLSGLDGLWLDVPIYADFGQTSWSDLNPAAVDQFMEDTGFVAPKVKDWNDPVWRRWIAWRHDEISRFLQDVTTAVREIDPEFILLAETLPTDYNGATMYGLDGGHLKNIQGLTHIWEVDTMSNTIGMRRAKEDDWISFISALKYTRAASGKKPSWVFSYGIEDDDAEQVMSQALIAGNNPYELKVPEMTTTVGTDFRRRMFGWTKANSPYLFEATSLATVGIWFSSASRDYVDKFSGLGMFVNTDAAGDPLWWAGDSEQSAFKRNYLAEFRGFVELCVNEHIPFNTLVEPDAAELASYDVIILPNIQALSDDEASLLRRFVENGGHMFATGPNPGGWDEFGNDRNDYALHDVLQISKSAPIPTEKSSAYGGGQTHFFFDQLGREYFIQGHSEYSQKISAMIRSASTIPIETDADNRVHAELSRLDDQFILQFTNFIGVGAGIGGELAVEATSFACGLILPPGKNAAAVELTSPDLLSTGRTALEFSQTGQRIDFKVSMRQHTMIVVSLEGAQNPSLNHVPAPGHDFLHTTIGAPFSFSKSLLISNDGDIDGDQISISNVWLAATSKGTLERLDDEIFLYTPSASFVGTDILHYDLVDGRNAVSVGRISMAISAPNQIYFPRAATVTRGNFDYGSVSTSLKDVDEETYDINSVQVSNGHVVEWEMSATISEEIGNIDSIEIFYAGHYNPRGILQKIFIRNYETASWELLDSSIVGDYDVPISYLIDDGISRYISTIGEVRVQLRATRNQGKFSSWANQMYWKITSR